jgi:hypothetical protein
MSRDFLKAAAGSDQPLGKRSVRLASAGQIDKPCCTALTLQPSEGAAFERAVKREAGAIPALCPQL